MNNLQFTSEPYIINLDVPINDTSLIFGDVYMLQNGTVMMGTKIFQFDNYSYQYAQSGDIDAPTVIQLMFGN
jgi:hypothetical protein